MTPANKMVKGTQLVNVESEVNGVKQVMIFDPSADISLFRALQDFFLGGGGGGGKKLFLITSRGEGVAVRPS